MASVANANAPVVIESIMRSMKIPMQKLMADSIKIKKKKSEVSFLLSPYLRKGMLRMTAIMAIPTENAIISRFSPFILIQNSTPLSTIETHKMF